MITEIEQQILAHIDDELIRWVQALTLIPSVWKPETGEGEEAAARLYVLAAVRFLGPA